MVIAVPYWFNTHRYGRMLSGSPLIAWKTATSHP